MNSTKNRKPLNITREKDPCVKRTRRNLEIADFDDDEIDQAVLHCARTCYEGNSSIRLLTELTIQLKAYQLDLKQYLKGKAFSRVEKLIAEIHFAMMSANNDHEVCKFVSKVIDNYSELSKL